MELIWDLNRRILPFVLMFLYIVMKTGSEKAPRPATAYHDIQMQTIFNIKGWSAELSKKLVGFSKSVTSFTDISEDYGRYFSSKAVSGDILIQTIANDINDLLKEKLDAVLALATEAERIYKDYQYDPDIDIHFLNSKKLYSSDKQMQQSRLMELTPDDNYNHELVNHENSTVHVPAHINDRLPKFLNGAYWTQRLNDQFKANEMKDNSLRWQYFCGTDGLFRIFPGIKWPTDQNGTDSFDCRLRPWYQLAATLPKNVLILMDSSKSMEGSGMTIARGTVKAILNTLGDDDLVNILRFSDKVEYIDDCFIDTLMPATTQNKRHLQDAVEQNVKASNTADFKGAFDKAYNILNTLEKQRRGRLCNTAILLITNSEPENYVSVFEYFTNSFKNITTKVFTFVVGKGVDDSREIRRMACANEGYYSRVSALADVQDNVQNYIKVMSRQMVKDRYRNKIWTPIYLDYMSYQDKIDLNKGLQFMISVAVPVFDKRNDTFSEGNLLGVMGTDMPIKMIKEMMPVNKLGANGYAFMINHNGYVLMHPNYRPYRKITSTKYWYDFDGEDLVLHPDYQNVEFTEVVEPAQRFHFKQFISTLLSEKTNFGSEEVQFIGHYENMERMFKRKYNIYSRKLQGSDFSIGIALPATSMSEPINATPVPSKIEHSLNVPDIELAPWFYCEDLDSALTGRNRIDELKRLVSEDITKCNLQLLGNLVHDIDIRRLWERSNMNSQGIELLFIGTSSGLSMYTSANDSVPEFVLDNADTLNALYYRRAVEGVERVDGQSAYSFTYSIPLGEEINPESTLVTASAPIIKANTERPDEPTVYAVVGFQMKFDTLKSLMNTATSKAPTFDGHSSACDGQSISCYLVDNHGYLIMSDGYFKSEGYFFGIEENAVMAALVRNGIFKGYNFTDYQALCEREIQASEKEMNSGVPLLNPIKTILNGLFWLVTEIFLCVSKFSMKSVWTSWNLVHSIQTEHELCKQILDEYDYEDLEGPAERLAYNHVLHLCSSEKKIVEHRPCHRSFTLYKANFSRSVRGSVKGCKRDYSGCKVTGCTGAIIECNIFYSASWVEDTNLLMVVVSRGECGFCEDVPFHDFGHDHTEIIESDKTKCDRRKRRKHVVKKFPCSDFKSNETLPCGTAHTKLPLSLLWLFVSFSLVRCLKF
ncbi:voltage-dependent calcium channel subunit alpha-2/delta-3-like isoform X2 [Mercenaria mercenaria]|uniref:voltage-dependent calcium channel subunit alpha-2/delta-3-like isoform X2 n=1 Tax=Mercenaria mercenaria TaxID=6596 RepID=UPI00234F6CE9|nr:voltage-dependent calcium channel subunit alpha-2/delta-3-like isoform X2 [Mercenaria mercenaria]